VEDKGHASHTCAGAMVISHHPHINLDTIYIAPGVWGLLTNSNF